ncbi:MAG: hypothetical protein Q9222_005216 [Ikaeria aurantiellina]
MPDSPAVRTVETLKLSKFERQMYQWYIIDSQSLSRVKESFDTLFERIYETTGLSIEVSVDQWRGRLGKWQKHWGVSKVRNHKQSDTPEQLRGLTLWYEGDVPVINFHPCAPPHCNSLAGQGLVPYNLNIDNRSCHNEPSNQQGEWSGSMNNTTASDQAQLSAPQPVWINPYEGYTLPPVIDPELNRRNIIVAAVYVERDRLLADLAHHIRDFTPSTLSYQPYHRNNTERPGTENVPNADNDHQTVHLGGLDHAPALPARTYL